MKILSPLGHDPGSISRSDWTLATILIWAMVTIAVAGFIACSIQISSGEHGRLVVVFLAVMAAGFMLAYVSLLCAWFVALHDRRLYRRNRADGDRGDDVRPKPKPPATVARPVRNHQTWMDRLHSIRPGRRDTISIRLQEGTDRVAALTTEAARLGWEAVQDVRDGKLALRDPKRRVYAVKFEKIRK